MSNIVSITNQTSGLMATGGGVIHAIILTPSTTKSVVTLYDGLSAAGTKLIEIRAAADQTVQIESLGIPFATGLWAVVDANTAYLGVAASWGGAFSAGGGQAGQ